MNEVRSAATDLAVAAAERIIAAEVTGKKADDMIDDSLKAVKSRLN